jgi:hypothetical protein
MNHRTTNVNMTGNYGVNPDYFYFYPTPYPDYPYVPPFVPAPPSPCPGCGCCPVCGRKAQPQVTITWGTSTGSQSRQ